MQRIPQPLGLITLERAGFPETLRAGRNDDEMEACVYDAAVIGQMVDGLTWFFGMTVWVVK